VANGAAVSEERLHSSVWAGDVLHPACRQSSRSTPNSSRPRYRFEKWEPEAGSSAFVKLGV